MRKVERLVVASVCVLAAAWVVRRSFNLHPPLPIEEHAKQLGYQVVPHEIRTYDGYLLTYHRISRCNASNSSQSNRVPVLVQHGLLGASSIWVTAEHSLGFSLADAGYDVWLGNARGNTYSRKHVKWDPDIDKHFWDFSWHELGYYDLPAAIDYILQETGKDKLFYIGHSMGTTTYLVMGSTRPEYMAKVHAAFLMTVCARLWHIQSYFLKLFLSVLKLISSVSSSMDLYEVLPQSEGTLWINQNICANHRLQFICRCVVFLVTGYNEHVPDRTLLPTFFHYLPAGASYKEFQHYHQNTNEGTEFQQYDYGPQKNLWKYKSARPPVYNLSQVTAATYVYYSVNDGISVPEDVLYTAQQLPNLRKMTKVADEWFNHADFMWAVRAKTLVYDDIIATLHNLTTS